MAIGVIVGGAVQAFCQLPSLYRQGYRWQGKDVKDPAWNQDPRLKQMLWMMVPGTLGLAATQVNLLVNTILATSQGPGAVSWLNYSFRLMQFPIGIFGVSLASATLPKVSFQWAKGDINGVSQTITQSLKTAFAVNLPAAAGLAFLGQPIIEMLFQYGRFYAEDTKATAMALAMYAVGLPAYSTVKVLVPACYALGNTRIPVISSLFSVVVTIVLNLIMVKPFGFWGLALGTSVAAIFNAIFLLGALHTLLKEQDGIFPLSPIVRSFCKYLLVALVMGGICGFTQSGMASILPDQFFLSYLGILGLVLGRVLKVGLLVAQGIVIILVAARALRLSEINEVLDLFKGKLKNKLRSKPT
jgi:putative peptidoglycan lipid II flippase